MDFRVFPSCPPRPRGLAAGTGLRLGGISALLVCLCLAAAPISRALAVDMQITVAGTRLHGTMLMPPGTDPFAAVLIVPGSGPTDRNGNQPLLNNNSLKLLAVGLLAHNIGSLRFDKRGVGRSGTSTIKESNLRFETYVEDTVAWARVLARQPRVAAVYLLGHSEGSLISALAVQSAKAAGVISLAAPCVPANELINSQVKKSWLPDSLKRESERVIAELVNGRTVAEVNPSLTSLFRPSVQPYLISWFRYKPKVEFGRLRIPVLVLHGLSDRQVSPTHAQLLYRRCAGCGLGLIEGMNHVLKIVDGTATDDMKSYNEPFRPVAPELLHAISRFVKVPEAARRRSVRRGPQGHRARSTGKP